MAPPTLKQRENNYLFNTWVLCLSMLVFVIAATWTLGDKFGALVFDHSGVDGNKILCSTPIALLARCLCSKTKPHILVVAFPSQGHVTPLKVSLPRNVVKAISFPDDLMYHVNRSSDSRIGYYKEGL